MTLFFPPLFCPSVLLVEERKRKYEDSHEAWVDCFTDQKVKLRSDVERSSNRNVKEDAVSYTWFEFCCTLLIQIHYLNYFIVKHSKKGNKFIQEGLPLF